MNNNEIQKYINTVMTALNNVQVSGMRNVQNMAYGMSILTELIEALSKNEQIEMREEQ